MSIPDYVWAEVGLPASFMMDVEVDGPLSDVLDWGDKTEAIV